MGGRYTVRCLIASPSSLKPPSVTGTLSRASLDRDQRTGEQHCPTQTDRARALEGGQVSSCIVESKRSPAQSQGNLDPPSERARPPHRSRYLPAPRILMQRPAFRTPAPRREL